MGSLSLAMGKFLKDGKIVVCLQGRYAGKKAVILKTNDDGGKERPYGHGRCRRCRQGAIAHHQGHVQAYRKDEEACAAPLPVKTFVKIVNYTHVMPTRYSVENTMVKVLKGHLTADTFTDQAAKKKFLKSARGVFENKYKERDGSRWLFEKLRF